jgi:hypothetical protein
MSEEVECHSSEYFRSVNLDMKHYARDNRENLLLILRSFTDNLLMCREGTEISMYVRQQEKKLTGFQVLQAEKYFPAKM